MYFGRLKVQNLVLKIEKVNRPRSVYSSVYDISIRATVYANDERGCQF